MAITGGLMLAVVLAGFFAAAVDSVVSRLGLERLDAPVTRLVAAHRTASLAKVARAISLLGSPGFTAALAVVVLLVLVVRLRGLPAAAFLAVAVGAGDLSYVLVKHLVHRARPPGALVHLPSFSFPSGHAVGAVALYVGLAWIVSRRARSAGVRLAVWAGALVLVTAIGAARVVLGVHYASDVIGGFALGAFWVVVAATGWGIWELRAYGPGGAGTGGGGQ